MGFWNDRQMYHYRKGNSGEKSVGKRVGAGKGEEPSLGRPLQVDAGVVEEFGESQTVRRAGRPA